MQPGERYLGKIALVTGSRRGVGEMVARHFLVNGATVIGFSRGASTLDEPEYHHFKVDVSDHRSVAATFVELQKKFDRVDIVINSAAVLTSQYAMIMPAEAAQAMVDTNLMGPFIVSREAAKIMRKNKWGRIINIGSMAQSLEPIGDSVYAACKAAIRTMANCMAREFAPFNVTCNTLAISVIDTDMSRQLPVEKIDAVIERLPLSRQAEEDDILNVIDFFCSERSSYITAQTLFLGGVH